jgi:alanine racemase
MNRLGLRPEEADGVASSGLPVSLLMSHLACGDDPASPMNGQQLARFREALARLPAAPASLAASGGVFLGRDYHFDLVRPGIGLYGSHPHPGTHPGHSANPMRCAVRLAGRVLQLRRIAAGKASAMAPPCGPPSPAPSPPWRWAMPMACCAAPATGPRR